MTFELSPAHAASRDDARAVAQRIAPLAVDIDRTALVPDQAVGDVRRLTEGDALTLVVAVEEIAVVSAALAALAASPPGSAALQLSGLRGANEVSSGDRPQLALAAVALGIGRAATDAALAALRRATATPGSEVEKPHWVVADVATELDAARLLTYQAARTMSEADIAVARLMTTAAASRAVDAAVRVVGAPALETGHVVERLTRDVRAVSVLQGTEEDQRNVAAAGMLPQ